MEIINFPDFLSKIITGINVNNTDVPEYAEFVQIIDRICSDGDLEKSYDEFIDNICAKLPVRFLICQIVDQQFTNVAITLFTSMIKLLISQIPTQHEEFVNSALRLVYEPRSTIYVSTESQNFLGISSQSPVYSSVLEEFSQSITLAQISMYFRECETLSFQRAYNLFLALKTASNNFNGREFTQCCSTAAIRLMTIWNTEDQNELRSIDESLSNTIIDYLCSVLPSSSSVVNDIMRTRILLNIKFVSSAFLNKRLTGLRYLVRMLRTSIQKDVVLDICNKRKVLQSLLDDLHSELVLDFATLFNEMTARNLTTIDQLRQFWSISLHQHSSSIDKFFRAFEVTINNSPKNYVEAFCEMVMQEDYFPDASLKFLVAIAPKFGREQKYEIFQKILRIAKEKVITPAIERALSAYLPGERERLHQIQQLCLDYITSGENPQLGLSVLITSCRKVSDERARHYIDAIIDELAKNPVSALPYFPSLAEILKNLKDGLTIKEAEKVNEITDACLVDHPDEVCSFYDQIIRHKYLFSKGMIRSILMQICTKGTVTPGLVQFVINTFSANDGSVATSEPLWTLAARKIDITLTDFICRVYYQSPDRNAMTIFVDQAIKFISQQWSLVLLERMILIAENGIDKEYVGFPVNEFPTPDKMIPVHIVGTQSFTMMVPYGLSYGHFIQRLCYRLCRLSNDLVIEDRGQPVALSVITSEIVLTVTIRGYDKKLAQPKMPTIELDKYGNQLIQVVRDNDHDRSLIALRILNHMPTVENELAILRNNPSWKTVLSFTMPYLFIYRLNAIGNLLKDPVWLNMFVETGGAIELIRMAVFEAQKCINQNLLLYVVVCLMESTKTDLSSFDSSALISIMELSIKQTDKFCLLCLLKILYYFVNGLKTPIAEIACFKEFIHKTLFTLGKEEQELVCSIIRSWPVDEYKDILVSLIPEAVKASCSIFFDLIHPIVLHSNNPVPIWNSLIGSVPEAFVPPPTASIIQKLQFQQPTSAFASCVFITLNDLAKKIDIIPNIEDTVDFLIDRVMLNTTTYYETTDDLVTLVITLLDKEPTLTNSLIPKIQKIQNLASTLSPYHNYFTLGSFSANKGLTNLGATCYMNSTLQQFYHIPEFRDAFLTKSFDEPWMNALQMVFAQLFMFPVSCVNPSEFTRNFQWWGEPLNPKEQQDAVEFMTLFLDGIEKPLPDAEALFKGEIVYTTTGLGVDYQQKNKEPFVVLPLEVKNHSDMNASFQTWLEPDQFVGPNKMETEEFGKIDATRTHKISKAPEILICHLKRFQYNFSTRSREKVNSFYQYYEQINLRPLMDDDSDTVYELIGVIMHTGSAISGHYFSHCKIENSWMTFNDSSVYPFTGSIVEAGTGGFEQIEQNVYEKTNNAYILFYRKKNSPVKSDQLVIEPKIMSSLLEELSRTIIHATINTASYHTLVFRVSLEDKDGSFVLPLFMTSINTDCHPSFLVGLARRVSELARDPKIADSIIDDHDSYDLVLLKMDEPTTREIYVEIVCNALKYSTHSTEFIQFLVSKLIDDPHYLAQYWIHFDQVFKPLYEYVKTVKPPQIKNWFSIILNFLASILPSLGDDIFDQINCGYLFGLMDIILQQTQEPFTLLSPINFSDLVARYIRSPMHTDYFIRLIITIIKGDESLSISPLITNKLEGRVAARLFVVSLIFEDWKKVSFSSSFMTELDRICLSFKDDMVIGFNKKTNDFVDQWILSPMKTVRVLGGSILVKVGDANAIFRACVSCMKRLFSVVNDNASDLKSDKISSDEYVMHDPCEEYFKLFKWAVEKGKLQDTLCLYGGIISEIFSRFGELPYPITRPIHLFFNFVFEAVGVSRSAQFFIKANYSAMSNALNRLIWRDPYLATTLTTMVNFAYFTPDNKIGELAASKHFVNICNYGLASDSIHVNKLCEWIFNHCTKDTTVSIFNALWKQSFSTITKNCNEQFFRLSYRIISKFPVMATKFEESKCVEETLVLVRNEMRFAGQGIFANTKLAAMLKLLAKYTETYPLVNQTARTFFGLSYGEWLAKYWKEQDLDYPFLVRLAKSPAKLNLAHNGICDFLKAVCSLVPEIANKVIREICYRGDFFMNVPEKSQRSASFLVQFLFKNYKNQMKEFVVAELSKFRPPPSFIAYRCIFRCVQQLPASPAIINAYQLCLSGADKSCYFIPVGNEIASKLDQKNLIDRAAKIISKEVTEGKYVESELLSAFKFINELKTFVPDHVPAFKLVNPEVLCVAIQSDELKAFFGSLQ